MQLILLVCFAAALVARLHHRNLVYWLIWGGVSVLSFLIAMFARNADEAGMLVLGSSVLGFLGPELWHALRGWVRRPQTITYLGVAIAAAAAIFVPGFLGSILILVIIYFGFRYMFRTFR